MNNQVLVDRGLLERVLNAGWGSETENALDDLRGFLEDAADHIEDVRAMVVPDIDEMVSRFLSWPLPADVFADPCASMPGYPHRHGTNLLTAAQAKAMLSFVLAASPAPGGGQ